MSDQTRLSTRWKGGRLNSPLAAFLIGIVGTIGIYAIVTRIVENSRITELRAAAEEIARSVDVRMHDYEDTAWTLKSLFAASTDVSADQFSAYLEQGQVFERYPHLTAVDVALEVAPGEALPDGAAASTPGSGRFVVQLAEPRNAVPDELYDTTTAELRDTALALAFERDAPTATPPIRGLGGTGDAAGIFVFTPVANTGADTAAVVQVLAIEEAVTDLFAHRPHLDFEIWDTGPWDSPAGEATAPAHVYDSHDGFINPDAPRTRISLREFAGRTWAIITRAPDPTGIDRYLPVLVMALGTIGSFLIAARMLVLARSRERAEAAYRDATNDLRIELANRTRAKELLTRALDRVQAATRSKSQFLANMSHEIRTPMNSVLGFTRVILDGGAGSITDEQRAFLERIDANGRHLLDVINQILDLSKIESGTMDMTLVEFDIREIVIDAANATVYNGSRGVEMIIDLPAEARLVRSDRLRLRQVLINLIGNARKFTEQGSVTVRLVDDEDGHPARLDIIDTGPGIAADDLESIFDAFTQTDGTTARKHEGTGLGLAISKQLIQLLAGHRITVVSEPGTGSTFSVHFDTPARVPAPGTPMAQAREAHSLDSTPRALFVHEGTVPRMLLNTAAEAGFETVEAKGAGTGLDMLDQTQPDIIVLTIPYPEVSGWEFLTILRSNPEMFDTPVVLFGEDEIGADDLGELIEAGVTLLPRSEGLAEFREVIARVQRTRVLAHS